jgi:hypothetical protein
MISPRCAEISGGSATVACSLVLLGLGLAPAQPASALTGADLLREVCLATFPSFEAASDRIASFRGRTVDYDGALFEQLDAKKRLSWGATDDSQPGPDRFLVHVAWGTFQSLPAASCFVIDKRAFTLAELTNGLSLKELRVRSEKVLNATTADAIVESADGRRFWLTLTLAPGHDDPAIGAAISVATLMSSDYLNALIEKAP